MNRYIYLYVPGTKFHELFLFTWCNFPLFYCFTSVHCWCHYSKFILLPMTGLTPFFLKILSYENIHAFQAHTELFTNFPDSPHHVKHLVLLLFSLCPSPAKTKMTLTPIFTESKPSDTSICFSSPISIFSLFIFSSRLRKK